LQGDDIRFDAGDDARQALIVEFAVHALPVVDIVGKDTQLGWRRIRGDTRMTEN